HLCPLVLIARVVGPAGEVHADRRASEAAQVVDPRGAEAADVVDEAGGGVPVAPFARDGSGARGAVDVAALAITPAHLPHRTGAETRRRPTDRSSPSAVAAGAAAPPAARWA